MSTVLRTALLVTMPLTLSCNDIVGSQEIEIKAELTGYHECLFNGLTCVPGRELNEAPRDVPFFADAKSSYARNIIWALDWEDCRKRMNCPRLTRGPFRPAENRDHMVAIQLSLPDTFWLWFGVIGEDGRLSIDTTIIPAIPDTAPVPQ